jgi:hypothetical protein
MPRHRRSRDRTQWQSSRTPSTPRATSTRDNRRTLDRSGSSLAYRDVINVRRGSVEEKITWLGWLSERYVRACVVVALCRTWHRDPGRGVGSLGESRAVESSVLTVSELPTPSVEGQALPAGRRRYGTGRMGRLADHLLEFAERDALALYVRGHSWRCVTLDCVGPPIDQGGDGQ